MYPLSAVAEYLLDRRVGIVQVAGELNRNAGAPNFFHYFATASDTSAFAGQANFARAGGASASRDVGLAKAIGEAVERYCAAIYDPADLPLSTYRARTFAAADPAEFALYSEAQYDSAGFPFVPFGEDTPVRWTPATDVTDGAECYVPAAMVFIPYSYAPHENERAIVQPISTGLACHTSPQRAAISAICEVIERDAFTITWQARLSPPRIDPRSLPADAMALLDRFARSGRTVTLFHIGLDIAVPTVLAVEHNDKPGLVGLGVAASTSLSPHVAVVKSLEELTHTSYYMDQVVALGEPPATDYDDIKTQEDHLRFWAEREHLALAEFLFSSTETVAFSDLPDRSSREPSCDVRTLAGMLAQAGHRTLIADVTTPDVGGLGLSVVRAVVPGLNPLFMGFRYRALGGRRLARHRVRAAADLPHPYP